MDYLIEPQDWTMLILWLIPVVVILAVWDTAWKCIAFWKAARNNHLVWFICIAVFNTAGILPIIYLLMHRNKTENQ